MMSGHGRPDPPRRPRFGVKSHDHKTTIDAVDVAEKVATMVAPRLENRHYRSGMFFPKCRQHGGGQQLALPLEQIKEALELSRTRHVPGKIILTI